MSEHTFAGGTLTLSDDAEERAAIVRAYNGHERRGTYRTAVVNGEPWGTCSLCGHRTPRVDVCLACQGVTS